MVRGTGFIIRNRSMCTSIIDPPKVSNEQWTIWDIIIGQRRWKGMSECVEIERMKWISDFSSGPEQSD